MASNLVASIIDSSERTHSSVGGHGKATSSRRQPRGGDLFQGLATALTALHARLSTQPPGVRSKVEIEVRLGFICFLDRLARATPNIPGSGAIQIDSDEMRGRSLRFVSGVSAPAFECAKGEVAHQYQSAERSSKEVAYVYEHGPLKGQRVVVDGFNPPHRELKETRQQVNFQLPAADYDLRIQASIEEGQSPPAPGERDVPADWSVQRTKRRLSWTSPADASEAETWLWQADLTLVEGVTKTANGGRRTHVTREVELELLPQTRDRWLELTDPEEVMAMTSEVATHLYHLLHALNPIEPPSAIAGPEREPDRTAEKEAENTCAQLRGGRRGKGSLFPGAQPVNMCKRHVPDVQRSSYFLAEKTDGVRYLMIALTGSSGPTCVLVNRSMDVFRVEGGPFLAQVLGQGTVLDGELVHNRSMQKAVFVSFDLLRHRDEVLMSQDFLRRLRALSKRVMTPYAGLMNEQGGNASANPHLMLVMKSFYQRDKIMDLFRHVRTEGRDRVFVDGSMRHHKTDGIIFQPDSPYTMGTDDKLLKWKWADLSSVDLRVYPAGDGGHGGAGEVRLVSEAGNHGDEVDLSKTVNLTEHDRARLVADMEGERSVIAEVALDGASGLWVYMGLRPDKDRPNFITTVIATMVEIAEGLSEDELKYRMLASTPAADDWARQELTMRKRAVRWQQQKQLKVAAVASGSNGETPRPNGTRDERSLT